jgi:hypothetical protein
MKICTNVFFYHSLTCWLVAACANKFSFFFPVLNPFREMDNDPENPPEQERIQRTAAERGLQKTDSNVIQWDNKHPDFPRNWASRHKFYDTAVIFLLEFYTTVISTTGPSAADQAKVEYGLSRVVILTAFQFTYGFGQALGGLLLPPYSESLGRRRLYLWSAAVYSISSLIAGVVPSVAGVFIGRFFSGVAAATPSVVVGGSIEDLYANSERIWLILLWNSCTTLGLCVGPIYGSYLVSTIGW